MLRKTTIWTSTTLRDATRHTGPLAASARVALLSRHLSSTASTKMSFPATIQAIGIQKTGDIEVVEKLNIPFPKQQLDQIVVKVKYGGVNTIDTYFR